jgi:RNA polymerase sigma-70 factor (TIGR02943 family)
LSTIESRFDSAVGPAAWLEIHGDVLWRYAMGRVRSAELAEELIQESLVAALESREGFRGECSERTWLLSILRHKMLDHFRRQGRERQMREAAGVGERPPAGDAFTSMFDEKGGWRFDPGPGPKPAVLDSPEFLEDFERCLAKMPAGLAEAFVMRELRAAASEAICAALQITLDNLWVRLHRARVLLRRCLSKRWAPVNMGKKGC